MNDSVSSWSPRKLSCPPYKMHLWDQMGLVQLVMSLSLGGRVIILGEDAQDNPLIAGLCAETSRNQATTQASKKNNNPKTKKPTRIPVVCPAVRFPSLSLAFPL